MTLKDLGRYIWDHRFEILGGSMVGIVALGLEEHNYTAVATAGGLAAIAFPYMYIRDKPKRKQVMGEPEIYPRGK